MAALGKSHSLTMLSLRRCVFKGRDGAGKLVKCLAHLEGCTSLEALDLSGATFPTDPEAVDDLAGLKNLRYLGLFGGMRRMDVGALRMAARCLKLEHLDLSVDEEVEYIDAADLKALANLASLKKLTLAIGLRRDKSVLNGLAQILGELKGLQELAVGLDDRAGGDFLSVLAESANLKAFSLMGGGDVLKSLFKMKQLERLYYKQGREACFLDSQKISGLAQLTKLNWLFISAPARLNGVGKALSGLKQFKYFHFDAGNDFEPGWLTGLPAIESLELETWAKVNEAEMGKCVGGLTSLKRLVLTVPVFGPGLASAIGSLKKLETLSLGGGQRKESTSLSAALGGLASLKELNLAGFAGLGATALGKPGSLPSLEKATLTFEPGEGDDSIMTALASCKALKSISIQASHGGDSAGSPRPGFTDAGLAKLAALSGLESLSITGADFTNASLKTAGNWKALRTLALPGCRQITDDGLSFLEGLAQLTLLDLRGTGISDEGLGKLSYKIAFCVPRN